MDYSDSYVSDCWPPSVEAGVPPVGTTVHCARLDFCIPDCVPELLGSVRVTKDCVSLDVVVALPEVSPAVFAGAAAVPVCLPAITGVVSSAVCAGGGGRC